MYCMYLCMAYCKCFPVNSVDLNSSSKIKIGRRFINDFKDENIIYLIDQLYIWCHMFVFPCVKNSEHGNCASILSHQEQMSGSLWEVLPLGSLFYFWNIQLCLVVFSKRHQEKVFIQKKDIETTWRQCKEWFQVIHQQVQSN